MDANILENNIEDEQQIEQERITAAAAAAAAAARRKRLELISVLQGFDEIPSQSKNKTDELVDHFLTELGNDVHEMLSTTNNTDWRNDDRGLDSDKDTEAEVEAIIRFFPHALSRNTYIRWRCHVKAVSFIPVFAKVAIELGLFEEQYRGGLLCNDIYEDNVLQQLMHNCGPEHPDGDDKCLQVLLELRGMGLLKKEDIQSYDLLNELCGQYYFFAEKRLRFLVEWDPNALLHPTEDGCLPIHCAAENSHANSRVGAKINFSIQRFQLIFEYGIRYFPKKTGLSLLFKKTNYDSTTWKYLLFKKTDYDRTSWTPFQCACQEFGKEKVMKIIEDTIVRYSDTPINITEALLTAAIDEKIHLDCVYFLLRRQPDMLQKLLSSASMTTIARPNRNIDDDDGGDDGNDGVSNNNLLVTGTIKKRKRE